MTDYLKIVDRWCTEMEGGRFRQIQHMYDGGDGRSYCSIGLLRVITDCMQGNRDWSTSPEQTVMKLAIAAYNTKNGIAMRHEDVVRKAEAIIAEVIGSNDAGMPWGQIASRVRGWFGLEPEVVKVAVMQPLEVSPLPSNDVEISYSPAAIETAYRYPDGRVVKVSDQQLFHDRQAHYRRMDELLAKAQAAEAQARKALEPITIEPPKEEAPAEPPKAEVKPIKIVDWIGDFADEDVLEIADAAE